MVNQNIDRQVTILGKSIQLLTCDERVAKILSPLGVQRNVPSTKKKVLVSHTRSIRSSFPKMVAKCGSGLGPRAEKYEYSLQNAARDWLNELKKTD